MKQVLGYFLGFAIFIAGIPALMWLVSGMPALADIPVGRLYLSALIALAGLSLSVSVFIGPDCPCRALAQRMEYRLYEARGEGQSF